MDENSHCTDIQHRDGKDLPTWAGRGKTINVICCGEDGDLTSEWGWGGVGGKEETQRQCWGSSFIKEEEEESQRIG